MDWRQVTFSFVAMDQIVNQAAKIHYMFGGQRTFPILYRANVGGGTRLAAQHCQCPYSMFMNLSGLKMFLPSTPADLKGLLKTAIRDNNPVISFESNRLLTHQGPGARRRLRDPARRRRHQAHGQRRHGRRRRLARARGAGRGRGACQGGDLRRGRRPAHARRRWTMLQSAARCRRPAGSSSPTRPARPPASRPRSRLS